MFLTGGHSGKPGCYFGETGQIDKGGILARLLTLMALMILGAGAVRTQQPSPRITYGAPNGVAWREGSFEAKVFFVNGALEGYITGAIRIKSQLVGDCFRKGPSLPNWFDSKATPRDIVKGMDSFYEDGGHISLPMLDAFVYTEMKLDGSSKEELASYLKSAR